MEDKNLICPLCHAEFQNYQCVACGYEVLEEKGVLVFPSRLVRVFSGYSTKTGLEAYTRPEPNPPSDYYPRYIPEAARVVLDVGGGDGWALAGFAQSHPSSTVYVVDADFDNLVRVPKRGLCNLRALNCTATMLPFRDESVDAVFTLFMVEHMYDYQYSDFLFEARRVLKPGGKLIVATDGDVYDKWLHPILRLLIERRFRTSGFLEKWYAMTESTNHHNLKSPYQTKRWLDQHGFFIQDIRLHLIAGRRWIAKIAYELLLPPLFTQKFLTTMYVVIARKPEGAYSLSGSGRHG
ncbi:MAG: methyltransferase domain-containing protein [Armatimonadota bacterium]|nr:methyltransferase domain-containing protein [Armatimonadota bacterium]